MWTQIANNITKANIFLYQPSICQWGLYQPSYANNGQHWHLLGRFNQVSLCALRLRHWDYSKFRNGCYPRSKPLLGQPLSHYLGLGVVEFNGIIRAWEKMGCCLQQCTPAAPAPILLEAKITQLVPRPNTWTVDWVEF